MLVLLKILSFILIFFHFFLFTCTGQSKEQNNRKLSEKIFFGGNIGLQLGTITFIDLSPLAGYRITDNLSAGLGITYMYFSDNRPQYDISTSIYGGRIFTRYLIIENVFAHIEYESLSLESDVFQFWNNNLHNRFWVTSFFVGGGYKQYIGERSSVNLLVLWNLNESIYSLYSNPVIRMGFNF